jgi:hypothetical protein
MTSTTPRDLPERILSAGVRCLPTGRAEWGRAMLGELAGVESRSKRLRFAVSGAGVMLTAPRGTGAPGRSIVVAMVAAAATCAGTVGVALVRYPGLATGRAWFAAAIFLGVLISYVVAGRVLVGRLEAPAVVSLRVAVIGAIGIAALWLGVGAIASYAPSKALSAALMMALPVMSFMVGGVATWQAASVRAGCCASLLSALGAGLFGFVIWMGDTLLSAGRPYDSGIRRDFAASGARDIATYAVNDNLGSAMVLLLLIPLLAGVFGFLGIATVRGRGSPHGEPVSSAM